MSDTNTKGFHGQKKGKDTYILDDSEQWLGYEATDNSVTCHFCIHWNRNKPDYDLSDPVKLCDAFDEIPREIWRGRVSHTKPYQGDRGIQFELKLKK
ncbi:MAG: hypothetical protein HZA08_04925 [Nitrospirae bacterium]|nr:hypothetical protein [Nitrospirota bacterium]